MENKMELVDEICAGMAVLDYFDDAIIGYNIENRKIVYDYNLMIKILIEQHKLDLDLAIEYLSHNVIGLKIKNDEGENIEPIIISKFEDEIDDKL